VRFEATIEISAPAQRVYDVYSDVERWPEWTESVTSVQRLDDGPLRVGSSARIKQPRLPTAEWEVTDIEPGRSFTWTARGPGIISTGSHVVARTDREGQVTATASVHQAGAFGWLLGLMTKRLTDRYLQIEVGGLKARCEA